MKEKGNNIDFTLSSSFDLAWHRGVGPDTVQVAEAHVGEALAGTPGIKGPGEAEDHPGEGREPHGDDAHHHGVHDIAIAY